MTQNTNLKRRAREFAAAHSISYATALRAVDEPLHELRNLIRMVEDNLFTTQPHFRLVGERGIYSPAFEGSMPLFQPLLNTTFDYAAFMDQQGLTRFPDTRASLRELGRRFTLLEAAGVTDIWSYRELHRGGLLGEGAQALEPFFHHYTRGLPDDQINIYRQGHDVGIFGVNISMLHELQGPFSLPVTQDQLRALSAGSPAGDLWLPRYSIKRKSSEQPRWAGRFARSYTSTPARWGWGAEAPYGGIRVLLEKTPEDEAAAFAALGLAREHFKRDESLEATELTFRLMADRIQVSIGHEEATAGSSQNLIFG